MPTLAQLGTLPALLPDSLLSSSPLWKREVKTVSPLDLALVHCGNHPVHGPVTIVSTFSGINAMVIL